MIKIPFNIIIFIFFPLCSDKMAISFCLTSKQIFETYYHHYPCRHKFTMNQIEQFRLYLPNCQHIIRITRNRDILALYGILQIVKNKPSKLIFRSFHCDYTRNEILSDLLPSSLTSLELQGEFNQPFPTTIGILPSSLKILTFGPYFNQPFPRQIDILPSSLTFLQFSDNFNQPFPTQIGILPFSLQSLTFGANFNQPFPKQTGIIPSSLLYLNFGSAFNQPLPTQIGILPCSLIYLKYGYRCSQNIPQNIRTLLPSLKYLIR